MKKIFLMIGLVTTMNAFGGVVYTNSVDLDASADDIRLKFAEYTLIPTKTEVRKIPDCVVLRDMRASDCEEMVVLESKSVIEVSIGYEDPQKVGEDRYRGSTASLIFKLEDFNQEDVATLKNARILSRAGLRFVRNLLRLEVKDVQREIMVIDMRNSKFCPINRERYPERDPDCEDRIAYKPTMIWVKEVTVFKK